MPRLTKAQAKKRLFEALKKVQAVYMNTSRFTSGFPGGSPAPVTTADMVAIEKIINKCLKRLN
jgi:hypothetical protein